MEECIMYTARFCSYKNETNCRRRDARHQVMVVYIIHVHDGGGLELTLAAVVDS